MLRRTLTALLPVALAGSLLATPTAQATETPEPVDAPPVITDITTENISGGLSAYLHLYSYAVVTFTDSTPSVTDDYRVRVPGVKPSKFLVREAGEPDTFRATLPAYDLEVGEESLFTVVELADGAVVSKSEPASFTFTYVGHPRAIHASSKKVDGQWSYRTGTRARLDYRGKWEPGTTISTQVWVSRTRKFTDRDWMFNVRKDGALVQKSAVDKPVLSFRVPRKHVGKFLWVSVRGWKDGEGGWLYRFQPTKIIRRG